MGYRLVNATNGETIEDDERLAFVTLTHITNYYNNSKLHQIEEPLSMIHCSEIYGSDGNMITPLVGELDVTRYKLAEFLCPRKSQFNNLLPVYGGFSINETIMT